MSALPLPDPCEWQTPGGPCGEAGFYERDFDLAPAGEPNRLVTVPNVVLCLAHWNEARRTGRVSIQAARVLAALEAQDGAFGP